METLTKTARFAVGLASFSIISTAWMSPAVAVPGDFSLDLCAGTTCATTLTATADPATGQLNVTFPDTPVGALASFSGLTFGGSIDPSVSGSFTLTNLSTLTQTFSVSATLGVLPVSGPTTLSGFYGPAILTDNSDDGAELAASPFYEARIDGVGMMTLGNFDVPIGSGSTSIPMETFPNQLGPAVTMSIGVAFPGFSLTGGDTVQVPFEFTVVHTREQLPEPASLALFGIAFAAVGLARRRRLN
jgi:PEP-CTERM motif